MKLLKFLVWLLLVIVSFDLTKNFLYQRSGDESESQAAISGKWNSWFGIDNFLSDLSLISQWLVGCGCIATVLILKNILQRILPKPSDIAKKFLSETYIDAQAHKRRGSHIACEISDTSINTITDDTNYEFPGQLSPSQLQVLLEELKFTVDGKFEEVDAWIQSNGHESKLWIKRLERVETEISYMRHQIFILMSNHAKSASAPLCTGDGPDSREQAETLRDLSTILAQVKKQFKEDELKNKSHQEAKQKKEFHSPSSEKKYQEINEISDESSVIELKPYEAEQRKIIIKELRGRQHYRSKFIKLPEVKQCSSEECSRDEAKGDTLSTEKFEPPESDDENTASTLNREGSNSTNQSEKVYEADKDSSDKNENLGNSNRVQEAVHKPVNLGPEPIFQIQSPLRQETYKNSNSPRPSIRKNSPSQMNNAGDCGYITVNHINEDSVLSTNLIVPTVLPVETEFPNRVNKETIERSASPKRTVRFAQDKREDSDRSASRSPKRDLSPVKPSQLKVVSDHKVVSNQRADNPKNKRETHSCPVVDDKRESRRTILERELNNLERKASPSPTRIRPYRKSNVRSKVAEYIKGNKPVYE